MSQDSATPGTGSSERASSRVKPSKISLATRPSGSPVIISGSRVFGSVLFTKRKSARRPLAAEKVRPTISRAATNTKSALIRLRRIVVQVAPHAVLASFVADETRLGHDGAARLEHVRAPSVKAATRRRVEG